MQTTELVKLRANGKVYLTLTLLENKVMELKWEGFTPPPVFREGIDKIGELSALYTPNCYVINLIDHAVIGPDLQKYAADMTSNYVKKYFEKRHGGEPFRQIMVVTKDIFIEVSASGYARRTEGNIESIFTTSLQEAYQVFDLVN